MNQYAVTAVNKLNNKLVNAGISDHRVLEAIASIPRESFLDDALLHIAYENTALPIGQGQTISQPYIVARMTELILKNNPQKVLEIGTGSGYQTAVLAKLVPNLYTIERIKDLQIQARARLKKLDLHNISFKYGDGYLGWPYKGPFDAIIVTAAASKIPSCLLEQLTLAGQLIIPVGDNEQQLQVITRTASGFKSKVVENVFFVPLIKGDLA